MDELEYNAALKRVNDAFEFGNMEEIFKSVQNYRVVWNKNFGENQFYHTQDYRDIVARLGNLLQTKDLGQATHYDGVIEMLPASIVTNALFTNSNEMQDGEFEKIQQYIIENGTDSDKTRLASLPRANFEKIEDSILQGDNTQAMREFFETYPKRANVKKIYSRMAQLTRYSSAKKFKKNTIEKALMKKYYDEYKDKLQEEFYNNRFRRE